MTEENENTIINEFQLLPAEKRTSLATVRTGIAVLALPLSVAGILIATSKYYNVVHVLALFIPLVVLCSGLVVTGSYLIARSILGLRLHDRRIMQLKHEHRKVAALVE